MHLTERVGRRRFLALARRRELLRSDERSRALLSELANALESTLRRGSAERSQRWGIRGMWTVASPPLWALWAALRPPPTASRLDEVYRLHESLGLEER